MFRNPLLMFFMIWSSWIREESPGHNETWIIDLNFFIEAGDITENNHVFTNLNRISKILHYLLKMDAICS